MTDLDAADLADRWATYLAAHPITRAQWFDPGTLRARDDEHGDEPDMADWESARVYGGGHL